MAEELYSPGGGANLTAAQTVQTQNCVDVTLAGNSTSAGAGFALISSGTMTLAGGANITLSQNANHVTIIGGAGGAFSAGVGTDGNTAGTTGTVGNGVLLVGGSNITLSQSSAAGGATVTIVGPNDQTFLAGLAGSGASTVTNGTIQFANSNNLTFGLNGSTMTASASFNQTVESQSMGMSNLGNTVGTTGIASGAQIQYLFAGGNNITLSQSINGASGTVTISGPNAQTGISGIAGSAASTVTAGTVQFANSNGVSFGLNGSTMTASYTQSVPPLISSFYMAPEGAFTSSQQANTIVSFQMLQLPYPLSFSRVDVPIFLSLASSGTAATGNIEISSGLVIYSVSGNSTLNPITGSLGTTTHTWASNTANFNNLTGARVASFALGTSLSAGLYYVGFRLSTTNNSSIGTATTQLANTISVALGSVFTASHWNDLGSATATSTGVPVMRGGAGVIITATNQTYQQSQINQGFGLNQVGNFPVLFRNV